MYLEGIGPSGAATRPNHVIDTTEMALLHAHSIFAGRALAHLTPDILDFLREENITTFFLAGGALLRGDPADLDLFPSSGKNNEDMPSALNFDKLAAAHATKADAQLGEVRDFPVKLQLCRHLAPDLATLVEGFDFAHCRVGVKLRYAKLPGEAKSGWAVVECHISPAFVAAMLVQGTYYAGGKWPLRSLSRVPKVAVKLGLGVGETRELAMQVTAAVVEQRVQAHDDETFVRKVLGVNLPYKAVLEGPAPVAPEPTVDDLFSPYAGAKQ